MPAADVNGVRLHYEERGQGPSVVLVHGGLSDYSQWFDLMARLSTSHRVVAYSRRNAYPNELRAASPAGLAEHAADLAALIPALGMAPACVVGESYGASIALECARWHPRLVRALVVDEPPIPSVLSSPEDAGLRAALEETIAAALAAARRQEPELAARTVVDYVQGAAGSYEGLPPAFRDSLLRNVAAFRMEFGAGLPVLAPSELAGGLPPTLWLTSSNGPRALARVTHILAAACGSRALEIPGTTHASIIADPRYLAAVEAFLGKSV